MNEPRNRDLPGNDAIPVVYPQYLTVPCQEDEISLVDLWIRLRAYKRIFWSLFLVLVVLGAIYALFLYQEKYQLNTAIQIGAINTGGQVVKIETPESLKGKLTNAILPAITARYLKQNPQLKRFETSVSSPKNSDIVVIQNKIPLNRQPLFTDFQKEVAAAVLRDHQQLVALYQTGLQAELQAAEAKLAELMDPRTLQAQLDKLKLQIQTAEQKLKHLQETQKIIETGGKESVLRSMTDEQKQLLLNRKGEVDDRVLEARFEEILLDNKIKQDQQNQAIEASRLKMDDIRRAHQLKVEQQQRAVEAVRGKLKSFNISRVVSDPVRSVKPAGLSRKILLVLAIFMAGFLAFMAVLLALFRDQVREREQEQN